MRLLSTSVVIGQHHSGATFRGWRPECGLWPWNSNST